VNRRGQSRYRAFRRWIRFIEPNQKTAPARDARHGRDAGISADHAVASKG
jgi:hypothetical protein